jgi:uncharacterized protein
MFKITRKEEVFFDMFVATTENSCKAAEMLVDLMKDYTDVNNKIKAIEDVEHEGDQYVHKILAQLNKSFITPIDREDVYLIAKELDNITDYLESTAHRFKMLNVETIREEAIKLAELALICTNELKDIMHELKVMKKSKTLKQKVIEVNRIENEGDEIYRSAMYKLFTFEKDAIEVIKWKEIYEYLENTLDACEDVANIVEGVVMKNA